MPKVSKRAGRAKRGPQIPRRFEALFTKASKLERRANETSPRRAARVAYVRWLAAALYFSRVLLERADRERRPLLVDWPAEALEDPRPRTPCFVLLPKRARR